MTHIPVIFSGRKNSFNTANDAFVHLGLAPERNLMILQSRDGRIRTRDLSVRVITALPTKPPSNIKISSETNLNVHLGIDLLALYKQRWPLTESDGYTHIIVYLG